MLMKPLPACNALNHFSIPLRQPAVAIHFHSLDSSRAFCTMLCCRERLSDSILKAFDLVYEDVDLQPNEEDCGLYSLAFATTLCSGDDPVKLHYHNDQM